MTRETKIGLLVGLAFIIVIGILLSDQLMRSTEPPPAPLAGVADTVRKATATPASGSAVVVSRVPPTVGDVTPENTVPVREEVVARPPPVTFVEIRPGDGGPAVVVPAGEAGQGDDGSVARPAAGNGIAAGGSIDGGTPVRAAEVSRARTLAEAAAAVGETLIGADGRPLGAGNGTAGAASGTQNVRTPPAAAVAMKQYKAENGDNLSKLAIKFFGGNTRAAREAIIAANPSLAANPDQILIGRVYNIPISEVPPAVVGPTATRGGAARPAPRSVAPVSVENWYTVKSGDSLWKIAVEQCGDKNMVSAIKELNRDSVKDWDRLQANTKLRLPTRAGGASARVDR